MARATKIWTMVLLVVSFNFNFFAQDHNGNQVIKQTSQGKIITDIAIKNYSKGIESENAGLRKSAVYMAGAYRITGLVKTLLKQFSKEKDDDIKIMIALAIYLIGDERGIAAVEKWQFD
jgi:HEAT repeat protein